jgi:hypothetical protein
LEAPLDFDLMYERIKRIVNQSNDPQSTWSAMLAYVRELRPAIDTSALEPLDVAADVQSINQQLVRLFAVEPVPDVVEALYFGIFDAWDPDNRKTTYTGFYVSGASDYLPEDSASLCGPVYFPDERFLDSSLLDAIREAVWDQEDDSIAFQALCLGAAGILARHAAPSGRAWHLVVGFDEGDVIEVSPLDGV